MTREAIADKVNKLRSRVERRETPKVNGIRTETKAAQALALMRRDGGVSLDELMTTLTWQRHTVRGFISTLGSKHKVQISMEKHETRGTVYRAL